MVAESKRCARRLGRERTGACDHGFAVEAIEKYVERKSGIFELCEVGAQRRGVAREHGCANERARGPGAIARELPERRAELAKRRRGNSGLPLGDGKRRASVQERDLGVGPKRASASASRFASKPRTSNPSRIARSMARASPSRSPMRARRFTSSP